MLTIHLDKELSDTEADKFSGQWATEDLYDTLIEEDATVYKPNGEPLLIFRKNIIPEKICKQAFTTFQSHNIAPLVNFKLSKFFKDIHRMYCPYLISVSCFLIKN